MAKKKTAGKKLGATSVKLEDVRKNYRLISKLQTREPFEGLFNIDPKMVTKIAKSIKANRWDESEKVVLGLWDGSNGEVVVDGYTRLLAAKKAGMLRVPVVVTYFKSEADAFAYSVRKQTDRRNLSDAEIQKCVGIMDKKYKAGRPGKESTEKKGASSKETAAKVGVSASKVGDARAVAASDDKKLKEAVEKGKKSMASAAKEARTKKKAEKSKKITRLLRATGAEYPFAHYLWNVTPETVASPSNTKFNARAPVEERIVFLSNDLLAKGNPKALVDQAIEVMMAKANAALNFMVNTTCLARLTSIGTWAESGANIWLGTTVATQKQVDNALAHFKKKTVNGGMNFILIEELKTYLDLKKIYKAKTGIGWVIIGGGESSTWDDALKMYLEAKEAKVKVFFLPSLDVIPQEFPSTK